jgi:hypothetical protein
MEYFRYVDDVLIMCNQKLTCINHTLKEFQQYSTKPKVDRRKRNKQQNKFLRQHDTNIYILGHKTKQITKIF